MLGALAVASFLIGIGKWTPLHLIFYHLPIYSGFRTWARFLCLLTFAVCALAGIGWDYLMDPQRRAMALKAGMIFCALAAVLALACLGPADALGRASASRALGLSLGCAGLLWLSGRRAASALLVLAMALGLHAWDQSEVAQRYLEFKDPEQFLQRPDFLQSLPSPDSLEPWRLLEAPNVWGQNANVIYGYESLLGYHGVQMAGPMQIQRAMQARQLDWLDMMNVRYVLSPTALSGLPLLKDGAVKIYANPWALPRAWLVGKTLQVSGDEAAFKMLAAPEFKPAAMAVLEQALPLPGGAKGSVAWVSRSPNHFELDVDAAQDCLLMVSNTYYPAWRAEIDGVASEILKADGALQGLALKAGKHRIRFYYSAALFAWACAAFFLGMAGLAWIGLKKI